MSVTSYQRTVARLTVAQAALQDDASEQQKKIAGLVKEIGDLERKKARTTSARSRNSTQRRLETKQEQLARAQAKLADIKGKQGNNLVQINRALQSQGRAENQLQRTQDATDGRRRSRELQHARALHRAATEQARLYAEMGSKPLVIKFAKLPEKITVLFLAADPLGPSDQRLRLDEEHRLIKEKLRASKYRDAIDFVSQWAVRSSDLLQALNEHQPHIVHFSGHGTTDEIVLQNPDGSAKFLSKEIMASTLHTVSDHVRVVVFNSCFSAEQINAVTEHVDVAIGMNDAIDDEAARVFAGQFYSGIGFGLSVQKAFDQAIEALKLELEEIGEGETPELHTRAGVDPNEVVLVRPQGLHDL